MKRICQLRKTIRQFHTDADTEPCFSDCYSHHTVPPSGMLFNCSLPEQILALQLGSAGSPSRKC